VGKLLGDLFEGLEIALGESHFVERQRLAGREDTHHHVFVIAGCGNGRDTEFDFFRIGRLEFDFANDESIYCRPIRLSGDKKPNRMEIPEEAAKVRIAFLPPMSVSAFGL
jgi:hypothetical protein